MPRPADDRADAKRAADRACDFHDRCLARGKSRAEATQLTVGYLLGRKVPDPEPDEREEWQPRDG